MVIIVRGCSSLNLVACTGSAQDGQYEYQSGPLSPRRPTITLRTEKPGRRADGQQQQQQQQPPPQQPPPPPKQNHPPPRRSFGLGRRRIAAESRRIQDLAPVRRTPFDREPRAIYHRRHSEEAATEGRDTCREQAGHTGQARIATQRSLVPSSESESAGLDSGRRYGPRRPLTVLAAYQEPVGLNWRAPACAQAPSAPGRPAEAGGLSTARAPYSYIRSKLGRDVCNPEKGGDGDRGSQDKGQSLSTLSDCSSYEMGWARESGNMGIGIGMGIGGHLDIDAASLSSPLLSRIPACSPPPTPSRRYRPAGFHPSGVPSVPPADHLQTASPLLEAARTIRWAGLGAAAAAAWQGWAPVWRTDVRHSLGSGRARANETSPGLRMRSS
ncbi:hypothetical protein B2J93_6171 [Marssonina coronariae]|uniref:Uncharacterized protein n=1 Tax=Diplocarpon coronariae TaxID=2795749 RepID=A0A218ZHX7_9HELO|nr:hypothetical protein B2J93_6171 [Marssonina coronariae]